MPYGQRHLRQEHLAVLRAGQPVLGHRDTAGNEHTGHFAGRVERAVVARLGDQLREQVKLPGTLAAQPQNVYLARTP